jgi:predicted O-methyltransferase YrrM
MTTAKIHFAEVRTGAPGRGSWVSRALEHPFFAWAGVRAPRAQHTMAEHDAMGRFARGCRSVVEIGVAEGASAVALRTAMDPAGTLYLVDPFHLSRAPMLNFLRRAARRAVSRNGGAQAVWIEEFSHEAARQWSRPIDFLLIDGDHRESAVEQDWNDWSPHVVERGVVVFHDARLFENGWTSPEYGPVRFVDRMLRSNAASPWVIVEEVDSLVMVRRKGMAGA